MSKVPPMAEAIADQVLGLLPTGSKVDWANKFMDIADEQDDPAINAWLEQRLIVAIGDYINGRKALAAKHRQNQRLIDLGISVVNGRPISPHLSVRGDDGTRQGVLWIEATPQQFVDAVFREQAVVDGRAAANAVRMQLAGLIQSTPDLMVLPSLREVCDELKLDPDTLGLEELAAG